MYLWPLTVTIHLIFPGSQTSSIDFVSSTEVKISPYCMHAPYEARESEGKPVKACPSCILTEMKILANSVHVIQKKYNVG